MNATPTQIGAQDIVIETADGETIVPCDRIVARLGWIPANTTAEQAHRLLAAFVPPGIRYDLHVAMIDHGRTVCRARQPRCGTCVLRDLCAWGSAALSRPASAG